MSPLLSAARRLAACAAGVGALAFLLGGCGAADRAAEIDELEATGVMLEDRGSFPFQGETMQFVVEHSGTRAELLEMTITVGYEGEADDGTPYIPIIGQARSVALARFLARVDDGSETYIDPQTWQPHYAIKDLDENDRHRIYFVHFFPEELEAHVEKRMNDKITRRTLPVPANTLDAISWAYHVRLMPLDEGTQRSWYIFDGWTISRLTAVVKGKEEVWTPVGFFDTRKIELYREKLDSHWPQGALSGVFARPELTTSKERYYFATLFLATDEHRVPVRLQMGTKLGDLDCRLRAWQPPAKGL